MDLQQELRRTKDFFECFVSTGIMSRGWADAEVKRLSAELISLDEYNNWQESICAELGDPVGEEP